jgi:uncharacterized membrane protein YccF (DUF307 family)
MMTNIIIRVLWAIFIGSWLMPIFYLLGVIFTALIITAPAGMWFFNKIGYVFSLYEDEKEERLTLSKTIITLLYFYFIGWWAGLIVIAIADACIATIIGFPIGFWLINRIDRVVILSK